MKRAVLLAFLCLSGCDGFQQKAEVPKVETGRWAVVPVPGATSFRESEGRLVAYAWRLDSVSGTVEMCTYSEFPMQTNKGQTIDPSALYCGHEYAARADREAR